MRRLLVVMLCTMLSCGVYAQTTELHSLRADNGEKSKVQYNLYVGGSYIFDFPVDLWDGDVVLYMPVGAPIVEFDVASRLNERVSVGGELSIMLPINPYAFIPYHPIYNYGIFDLANPRTGDDFNAEHGDAVGTVATTVYDSELKVLVYAL